MQKRIKARTTKLLKKLDAIQIDPEAELASMLKTMLLPKDLM